MSYIKHLGRKTAGMCKQAGIGSALGRIGRMMPRQGFKLPPPMNFQKIFGGFASRAARPQGPGMVGRFLNSITPRGSGAAMQMQQRSLGGINNIRHNLGAMGQWARQGTPMNQLMSQGGRGMGHAPTMLRPQDMMDVGSSVIPLADDALSSARRMGPHTAGGGASMSTSGPYGMYNSYAGAADERNALNWTGRSHQPANSIRPRREWADLSPREQEWLLQNPGFTPEDIFH